MAKIIQFEPLRREKRVPADLTAPCRIILFTGVQYEHSEKTGKRKKVRTPSSTPRARRRKAELHRKL